MNQVFLLKQKCFTENLLCWRAPNHLSLSYSHREEMAPLQPLLPLLMFQPYCASPCAHSGSISQSTHLLNGPNILYWEVYVIFKQYEERETELLNKERETVQLCDESVTPTEQEIQPTLPKGHRSLLLLKCQFTSGIFDTLWLQMLVKHLRAWEKPVTGHSHP